MHQATIKRLCPHGGEKNFFFCSPPQTDTISLLPPSKTILAVTDASFCGDGCISYQPPYIYSSSHIMRSYPCRLEAIREAPGRCVGEPQGPAVQKRSPFFPPRKKLFKICSPFECQKGASGSPPSIPVRIALLPPSKKFLAVTDASGDHKTTMSSRG